MSKLIPLHHIMEVEEIFRNVRAGGVVTKSNFLQEGEKHLFPLHDEVSEVIKEGDKVRITFYSTNDDIKEEDGVTKFKTRGVKYEVWNESNSGWDRIYEEMKPQENS